MANSSVPQKNRARPGFCSAFAGVLNAQALEGLAVSAADMAEARSTHPATARKPMDRGKERLGHHSHSWHQLLLLLARNSEEPCFRSLSAVFRGISWRSRHDEHSNFPLLRQYAAIERSMRMELSLIHISEPTRPY